MRNSAIPNTALNPSVICLGCGNLGGSIDQAESFALLDRYLEMGGNFLDTAKVYADWLPGERSSSEKTLGRWMKQRGNRQRVIVATKGAHPDLATMHIQRLAPEEIKSDLEESLRSLQTDCIDLYWLHRDDPTRPVEEIVDTLYEQQQAGKIRAYGCSNWHVERLQAAQRYANQRGIQGFAATSVLWNLASVDATALADQTIVVMDRALWNYHKETQLAAVPFTSQANGLFQKLEAGQIDSISAASRSVYLTPETEQRFARLTTLQNQIGLTTTQIVLGYLLSQPFPTFPIIGPRTLAQLEDSLSAANVRLSPDQLRFLEGE